MPQAQHRGKGFSLPELLVALTMLSVAGALVTSYLSGQTLLFAKNTALNQTHLSVRRGLDRLTNELQRTVGPADLLDADGAVTALSPAAGVQFDRLVGDPYVLNYPAPSGLQSTDTSLTFVRSTDPLSSSPLPQVGDAILIDLPSGGTVRAQIATVVPGVVNGGTQRQSITVTLVAPLGTAIDWRNPVQNPPQEKTVRIVRREAFLVQPNNGRNELRFYGNFEPIAPATVASILNDPTRYVLLTDEVNTATMINNSPSDATPFSVDNSTGTRLVNVTLGTEAPDYTNSLKDKEAIGSNTFVRVRATLSSRLH